MDGYQIGPIFEGSNLTNKIFFSFFFKIFTCKAFSASGLSYFRVYLLSSVIELVAVLKVPN